MVELLGSHKVSTTAKLGDQREQPVVNVWEGVERFLKVVEVTGKVCLDAKDFQQIAEGQLNTLEEGLARTVTREDFD